jgi:hypothetical protein
LATTPSTIQVTETTKLVLGRCYAIQNDINKPKATKKIIWRHKLLVIYFATMYVKHAAHVISYTRLKKLDLVKWQDLFE